MTDIPLKDNIKHSSLPKLLAHLNRGRLTGTLVVKTLAFTKKVFFNKGEAIFASSTYEDDRLGEMLIKAGKITMEQYDKSVEVLKKSGKRLGAILVENGYISPKDLFWGVKYQVREIVYSLFLLEDAEYEFTEGDMPSNEVITLKMSMGNLIYEGVKRIDNWTRIKNEMPGTETVVRLSSNPATLFQNVELSPQDRKMLSIINGRKTIKELVDSAWIGSFEGMKILYVLWSIGVIEEKVKETEEIPVMKDVFSLDEILQPTSGDDFSFVQKVDELYINLDNLSPNDLLEVSSDPDPETLTRNYYRLTREFHPDRYLSAADPTLKDKLNTIFDAIEHAYAALKKDDPSMSATTELQDKSQDLFKQGVAEFKKGNFPAAAESFRSAAERSPDNAKLWSYLSLALIKIPNRIQDAEKALLEAIKVDPHNADHYVNLGLIYLKQNMKKMASLQFEKALKLDPQNAKAKKGYQQTRE
ncbi:MAG: DUF4388 domain-containing protein [Nitrospirota bacterium]